MLKLRVRNVVGISRADIDLTGIVLVGGHNGAGKTSLLQCAASALLGTPAARGISTKHAAAALLRDGKESGSIVLEHDTGQSRINYPEADAEQKGTPRTFGSALGIGSAKFSSLTAPARMQQIADRFSSAPTLDDVIQYFRTVPDHGLTAEGIKAIWENIEEQGWDIIARRAKEHGTKLKGRWEQVTKQRWGDKIRRSWLPDELERSEIYDIIMLEADVASTKARVLELRQAVAVSAADRERLATEAALLGGAEADLEAAQKAMQGVVRQQDRIVQEVVPDLPEEDGGVPVPTCPHCQGRLRIARERSGAMFVEKAPEHVPAGEVRRIKEARAAQKERLDAVMQELREANNDVVQAAARCQSARAARQEMAALGDAEIIDPALVQKAQMAAVRAEGILAAAQSLKSATEISDEFDRNIHIVNALESSGVRSTVLNRKMSELAGLLGEFSSTAGFPDVSIDNDMGIAFGGRSFQLLSRSEQWRCDFTIGMVLAQREKAACFLVDELDMLHPQARPGVIKLLRQVGIPALIGMTAKDPSAMPDLAKARLGSIRWLENGELKEVAAA